MASQIATDVLIIEDEPLIAMNLEQVVKRLGHRVVGVARTRADALIEIHAEWRVEGRSDANAWLYNGLTTGEG